MLPVFAGETVHVEIRSDNPSAQTRLAIGLSWPRSDINMTATADVLALQSEQRSLALPATRRGWLRAGVFSVSTEYPLGLFHAWTWAELDITTPVFPQPAVPGPVPPGSGGQGSLEASNRVRHEEFSGRRRSDRRRVGKR